MYLPILCIGKDLPNVRVMPPKYNCCHCMKQQYVSLEGDQNSIEFLAKPDKLPEYWPSNWAGDT